MHNVNSSRILVTNYICDVVTDTLTAVQPKSSLTDRCLALSKLIAVVGLGASAFIAFGALSTILSSTLLLTSVKIGLVVSLVIISHDIYATAKKKQISFYAPANGGSLEDFFDSAFSNTWCKPLWIHMAMEFANIAQKFSR